MANEVTTLTADFNGRPIDVLEELIRRRADVLRETTRRSTIATAINVFTSLKADTKRAPLKGNRKMYTIERTGFESSWARKDGKFIRVARHGDHIDWNVTHRCQNCIGRRYVRGEKAHVYKMQLFNENLKTTVYYAHARDEKQARDYIEKVILARLLKKEAGMAKYAIAMAQARVSDRPITSVANGSKQFRMAREAGKIKISDDSFGGGKAFVHFFDDLRYSVDALKHGEQSLDLAMMKAANKTAGIIHRDIVEHPGFSDLSKDCPNPPFPEVATRRKK